MTFSNIQVDATELPRLEQIVWQTLSPRYAPIAAVQTFVVVSLGTAGVWLWPIDTASIGLAVARVAVPLIGAAMVMTSWFTARAWRFALREQDVLTRHGLFWQRRTVMALARVQHVEQQRGPIDRWLGLAQLKFFTAGGAGADLTIPGLPKATADRLQAYLLDHHIGQD